MRDVDGHASGEELLLDRLEDALVPQASPSAAEVRAFLAVVADGPAGAVAAAGGRRWWPRVLAGGIAVVAVSGGTAYAVGGDLPRPVREAAVTLRLPVDSPELAEAKRAVGALDAALASGRADAIERALDDVEDAVRDLDGDDGDAAEVAQRSVTLAARATQVLIEEDEDDDGGGLSSSSGSRSGPAPAPAPSGDSSGPGSRSGSGSDSGSDDSSNSGSGSSGSGSGSSGSGSGDDGDEDRGIDE